MRLLLAALALLCCPHVAAHADLESDVAGVLPRAEEERWLRIPWEPNLMLARATSQRMKKPMLIWIMDGNVLGCT